MFVRPFRYVRVESVADASAALAEHGLDAKVLAGGQTLMPMLNLGLLDVDVVIDITGVEGLDGVSIEDGSAQIGALIRHREIERHPLLQQQHGLLVEAIRHVGNPRVRNAGTVGGSLAHNDPAAELPMVMAVLGGEYELSDGSRSRTVGAEEFSVTYFTTALEEEELLVSVRVPPLPAGWGWGFEEFCLRAGDFAIVAAAAAARVTDGRIEEARLGMAGAADKALRCRSFEAAVAGSAVADLEDAAETIDTDIDPMEHAHVSAAYRRRMARVFAVRAMRQACSRAQRGAA